MPRARRGHGEYARRLTAMLEEKGFTDVLIIPTAGAYLNNYHDCCRWEANANWRGQPISLMAWDTMTACVRRGFDVHVEEGTIYAREVP